MTATEGKTRKIPIGTRVIYKNPHAECYMDGKEAIVLWHEDASHVGIPHMIEFVAGKERWHAFADELTIKA